MLSSGRFLVLGALSLLMGCSPAVGGQEDPSGTGGTIGDGGPTGGGPGVGEGTGGEVGTGGGPVSCDQQCPTPQGVEWMCKQRFMLGANYGWLQFATDFGGQDTWGRPGVSEIPSIYSEHIQAMKAGGSSVIRWWMWPEFSTDSIYWAGGAPSGIGGTLLADVEAALAIAEQHDVYLMLTPFSFNNFDPSRTEGGVWIESIVEMVRDAGKRTALLENLVRPVARAVEASAYAHRMIAWDLMNEPEWAVRGNNPYNREPFRPDRARDQQVSPEEMKLFLDELAAVLRQESTALLNVGSASIGWASAWRDVDVDFYQVHYYDWTYEQFPYTDPQYFPEAMGLAGKPVVMGEFPYGGLPAVDGQPAKSLGEFLNDMWAYGYAGALGWSWTDTKEGAFNGPVQKAFADAYPCQTSY